ncbi:LysR family transcriptional regulator [Rhodococcus qingshengii]|nr:LysR family transcriptional regulator [Rhodococcus qingshengii]
MTFDNSQKLLTHCIKLSAHKQIRTDGDTSMDSAGLMMLVEILDAGSISEAARRLKMTRANVGYHLKQLETDVGVELIRRTTRRIEPTDLGMQLYRHGRTIQDSLQAARESVATQGETLQGRVRLSLPNSYGELVLAPKLLEFKRNNPKIILDVIFENRITDLIRDEVDIAVRLLSDPPPNLDAWELDEVGIIACATTTFAKANVFPSHPDELRSAPVITASVLGRQLRLSAYQNSSKLSVPLEPTLTSHNFVFLRDAILADLGIGLVADYLVEDHITRGELVTTLDDWRLSMFGTRMYLLTMPSQHQSRAISTIIEYLVAALSGRRVVHCD